MANNEEAPGGQQNVAQNTQNIYLGQYKLTSFGKLDNKSYFERESLERGGMIILHSSVLSRLSYRDDIPYPLLFKIITGENHERVVICGVASFEGKWVRKIYLPEWMMNQLESQEESDVHLFCLKGQTSMGDTITLQPETQDFLDVTDHRSVLEMTLRSYTCISRGDIIHVHYNHNVYRLRVAETLPERTVLITNCDLRVEFLPPLDYVEPQRRQAIEESHDESDEVVKPTPPHASLPKRLDGRPMTPGQIDEWNQSQLAFSPPRRGTPNYRYRVGVIKFSRSKDKKRESHQKPSSSQSADLQPSTSCSSAEPKSANENQGEQSSKTDNDLDPDIAFLRRPKKRPWRSLSEGPTPLRSPIWTRSRARTGEPQPAVVIVDEDAPQQNDDDLNEEDMDVGE